jgi:hypothetical protein
MQMPLSSTENFKLVWKDKQDVDEKKHEQEFESKAE